MPGKCVGIIGLGRMGSSAARRFLSQGYRVVVWNRTPSKVQELEGVHPAESPLRVAEECGVVHVFVADDDASRQVLMGPRGVFKAIRAELVVVNHSTVTPMHSLQAWKRAEELRINYLEAPVVGGPHAARLGKLLVLVAGDKGVYERVLDDLRVMGEEVYYVGEIPSASVLKLSINSMFFISIQALSEAIGLVKAWGIEPGKLKEVASLTWLKPIFDKYYERVMNERAAVGFTVKLAAKDLMYAQLAGYVKEKPLHLISTATQSFIEAARHGYSEEDYSRIGRYILEGSQEPETE